MEIDLKGSEVETMETNYSSTTVLLVRHAQARSADGSYGLDTPLSGLGRRQAEAVAVVLTKDILPSAVYTSPFPRAAGTAAAICKLLDVEPIVEPRLSEFEVGACTLSSIEERQDLVMWRPEHRGASGETLGEFANRVAKFCDEVASRHLGSTIVLVAHAGSIDAAFRWWLGISTNAPWQFELDVSNASITELEVWPNGRVTGGAPKYAVVRRVADASHMGERTSDI